MEKIMETFGKRLKELRTQKHKTQVEMAELLECTDRHYQSGVWLCKRTLPHTACFGGLFSRDNRLPVGTGGYR